VSVPELLSGRLALSHAAAAGLAAAVLAAVPAEPDDVSSLLPHAATPRAAARSNEIRSVRMGRI